MDQSLTRIPQKRIRPYDGMAVTAKVWEDAHAYHRQAAQKHVLLFHGSGILTGLEVIAHDPPGSIVYVRPGAAIDEQGRVMVLADPVAYDLGDEIKGPLYLCITYSDSLASSSAAGGEDNQQGEPAYVQEQFIIAVRITSPEEGTSVELARFMRDNLSADLKDAEDPDHPGKNEIDLRYRRVVRAHLEQPVTAAVIYLGVVEAGEKIHGRGLARMGREVRHYCDYHLIVEDDVPLDHSVMDVSFLYLVCVDELKLSASLVKHLKTYLESGGTLFCEALNDAAQETLRNLAWQLGIKKMEVLNADISLQCDPFCFSLLNDPFYFSAPPAAMRKDSTVEAGGGFILSTAGYGAFWKGRDGVTRADLRDSMEWGVNLLAAVVERHSRVNDRKMRRRR